MNQLRTLCVMGTFDGETNREVARIKEKLKARGLIVDGYEPHITFGIYTELNSQVCLSGSVLLRHGKKECSCVLIISAFSLTPAYAF